MRFPYAFIFPAEGTFWQDNPACLLDASWVSAEQGEAAQPYREYLLALAQQDRAVKIGLRPAVAGVPCMPDRARERHRPAGQPADRAAAGQRGRPDAGSHHRGLQGNQEEGHRHPGLGQVRQHGGRKADERGGRHGQFHRPARSAGPGAVDGLRSKSAGSAGLRMCHVRDGLSQSCARLSSAADRPNDAVCAAVKTAEAARSARPGGRRAAAVRRRRADRRTGKPQRQKDVFACLPTGEDVDGVKVFTIAYGQDADKEC